MTQLLQCFKTLKHMPPLSHFKIDDEVLEKLFKLFFEVVGKNHQQEQFEEIIKDIFSPVERIMIAKRVAVVYLLMKNIDYLTICQTIKVSSATVSKFNFLMTKSTGVVPALNKILKNEKIEDFFGEIISIVRAPGVPGVNWSQAWRDKITREEKKRKGI